MDRLNRLAAGLGLALVVASGCRTAPQEVPPGRPFTTGAQPPSVGFSTSPGSSPYDGLPTTPGAGTGAGQYGLPAPGESPYGAPTGNSFGPPGTTGMTPAASPTGAYDPAASPTGGFSPFGPAPAQGTMGTPGQPPSPL